MRVTKSLPGSNSLMVTGIILIAVGLFAIFSPVTTGGAVVIIVALILLVTGITQLAHAWRSAGRTDTIFSTILGAVVTILGVMVWVIPDIGARFLTILMMIFFIAHGVWKISTAVRYRFIDNWNWLLLSGLLSLLFAYLLVKQWPLAGEWAIGIWVGSDLLLTGIAMVLLAVALRRFRAAG